MTKTALSIAAALWAASTLFAPAALACISCEYVPEVVKANKSRNVQKRTVVVAKQMPAKPSKNRIAKAAPSKPAPKKVEVAKVEPAKAASKPAPVAESTSNEPRPVSTAALIEARQAPAEKTEVAANTEVGCKKFIPTAGMTITVPCE